MITPGKTHIRAPLAGASMVLVFALVLVDYCTCAARATDDHLVPADEFLGDKSRAEYRELWQQKLLVTPGDVARFIGLPGTFGEETAVSIYREPAKKGGMPGDYWVTATQATESLWNHLQHAGAKSAGDARAIPIQRCDAPLPESTARAVRDAWLTLLLQTRPKADTESIGLDGSTEIVSARSSSGDELRALVPDEPGPNTVALINMANLLMRYCDVSALERPELLQDIEKTATELLMRAKEQKGGGPHF